MTSNQEVKPTNSMGIQPFEKYVFGEDFDLYEERLIQHFLLNEIPDEKRVAFLLTHIGNQAYEVLKRILAPTKPDTKTYKELIKELSGYFTQDVNEIPERYKFFQESQKSGQSVKDYAVELRRIASKCNFDTFLEQALRDRFVFGLLDDGLRTHLLKQKKITFKGAYEEAVNWEMAVKDSCKNVIGKLDTRGRKKSRDWKGPNRSQSRSNCGRCGRAHNDQTCPVMSWICRKCQKQGHIAKMCRTRSRSLSRPGASQGHTTNSLQVSSVGEELSNLDIFSLTVEAEAPDEIELIGNVATSKPLIWRVCIQGKEVMMEVDSGACSSVLV